MEQKKKVLSAKSLVEMTVSQLCNPFHLTPVPCDLIGMKSVVMKVVIT